MEAGDVKGPEVSTPQKSSPADESTKPKVDISEKAAVENGGADKKAGSEKEVNAKVKEESNNKNGVTSNKPTEPASNKQNNTKSGKSSREDRNSRRKDERSVDQVMRALNAFESPQDKLEALVKKYSEVVDENRKFQTQTKNIERRLTQLEREKDSAQSEHSKAVLARSRLEGLCRELQRQNRAIKEESVLKIREEEEKRKEVSNKFQSTLAEITSLMQQNNEKNSKLRDDNIEMTTKFKSVCEQYELRVQQVEKISKQMQLETQLADAKLAKAHLEGKAERETLIRDKHELLVELAQYQARLKEQEQTELKLREQVELYTNKYDEFQTALSRSNEVFGGFKEEMDKMSKKIVKLEKETSTWKLRWEKSHQALLEMATDKQQRDAELSIANRQLTQLHKLCRTLTEERAKLMAQINGAAKEPDVGKEEKLAADIAEDRRKLNDTLDSLQSVILERELLHKQQLLEKQQQQLQVELQKHITASASNTEPTTKASDSKVAEKLAEAKTNDPKQAENKAAGGKNLETNNKKKGKKTKSSAQKPAGPEEVKDEFKEKDKSQEENQLVVSAPEETVPEPSVSVADTIPSISEPSDIPSVVAVEKENTVQQETHSPAPPVPTPDSIVTDTLPTQVPIVPTAVPSSEPTSAPVAFSYAAAVGSKPAEHPVVEKLPSIKTEEKPVVPEVKTEPSVSENEAIKPVAVAEAVPNVEAVNGATKPIPVESPVKVPEEVLTTVHSVETANGATKPIAVETPAKVTEEVPTAAPSTVPSSKKSKKLGCIICVEGCRTSLTVCSILLCLGFLLIFSISPDN